MTKAYLAYSSDDRRFVQTVADQLGRGASIFDQKAFAPGVNLLQAMQTGVESASIFVFFASRASLASTWVSYEITEAEWRKAAGQLAAVLTFVIDDRVSIDELPPWMRRSLVEPVRNPRGAVRAIQWKLAEYTHPSRVTPFVGREEDLEEISKLLIAVPPHLTPRVIVVHGLDGVGRRTFIRRALKDYLSISEGPVIELADTDTIESLHLRLLDETEELKSREELKTAITTFAASTREEKARELARQLAVITKENAVPVVIDDGALRDELGRYIDDCVQLFKSMRRDYPDAMLVIIQRQFPQVLDLDLDLGIAVKAIRPLTDEKTSLLLSQHLRQSGVSVSKEQVAELVTYMGGYPPAVEHTAQYAKQYGIDLLLKDKVMLGSFLGRSFAPYIRKLQLDEIQTATLRFLAGEMSLNISTLAKILGCPEAKITTALRTLIDLNLVMPVQDHYHISPPIVRSVEDIFGMLRSEDYALIAKELREAYWKNTDAIPSIAIVEATVLALARSNSPELREFRDITLPSALLNAAVKAYHAKEWDLAINFANQALSLNSELHKARRYLFQAWTRKGDWQAAEQVLADVEKRMRREQFYLKGFLEWKRGNLPKAVNSFKDALSTGNRGIHVLRDLAHCLLKLHQPEEALKYIKEAEQRDRGNRFIADIGAQIAIALNDDASIQLHLKNLEQIDVPENVHHRMATWLCSQKKWPEALQEADAACNGSRPRFEAAAQRCDILIELRRYPEAEQVIRDLKPGADVAQRDVKTGLQCKLLLRQGSSWRATLVVWDRIVRKDMPVHIGLHAQILRQKADDTYVPAAERRQAEEELKALGKHGQAPFAVDNDNDDPTDTGT